MCIMIEEHFSSPVVLEVPVKDNMNFFVKNLFINTQIYIFYFKINIYFNKI
jgi:hypothetical protein